MNANNRQQRERELLSFIQHKRSLLLREYKRAMKLPDDQPVSPGTPAAQMIMAILDREFPQEMQTAK